MGTSYHSVLQQLEDLRLAEWSDQAPPPPSHPGHRPSHTTVQSSSHTYANYPSTSTATSTAREEERRAGSGHHQQTYGDSNDPIYQPGQYAVRNQHFYVFLCILHKTTQPTCCLLVFTIPSKKCEAPPPAANNVIPTLLLLVLPPCRKVGWLFRHSGWRCIAAEHHSMHTSTCLPAP